MVMIWRLNVEDLEVMDGDSVAELCWQTRLRMDVGGQRQSRRPRRVRDRVKAEMEAEAEAGTNTLKITGHQQSHRV